MTFGAAIVGSLFVLTAISVFVPKANEGVLSFYDAGLLANLMNLCQLTSVWVIRLL
jgi:hypothetical protein